MSHVRRHRRVDSLVVLLFSFPPPPVVAAKARLSDGIRSKRRKTIFRAYKINAFRCIFTAKKQDPAFSAEYIKEYGGVETS